MFSSKGESLKGINFHVHGITMPHRKSSVSLLKIEYDDYQSMYSKVNPAFIQLSPPFSKKQSNPLHYPSPNPETVSRLNKNLLCRDDNNCEEFGIFNLIESDEKSSNHSITIELYSDQTELELICAGKVQIPKFHSLAVEGEGAAAAASAGYGKGLEPAALMKIMMRKNLYWKTDPIMNCCNFFTLNEITHQSHMIAWDLSKNKPIPPRLETKDEQNEDARRENEPNDHILRIPLYYKTQGRYSMDAGHILLSVRVYKVDLQKLQAQLYLSSPQSQHVCWRCDQFFPRLPQEPAVEEMETAQNNTSFQSQTTKEEEEVEEDSFDSDLLKEDYDSVDEFIDQFNRKGSLQELPPSPRPPPPPPSQQSVQFQIPKKKPTKPKPRKRSPSGRRQRDYVHENTIFPKPRKPSRSVYDRYLKFK